MDDTSKTERVFTVDFKHVERRFKAMESSGGSIIGMRNILDGDVQRAVSTLNDFIDARVKSKYQDELRQHISEAVELWVSLGIAEFKLAAKDVKVEDLTQGKRAMGELARSISVAVKNAHPELTTDQLRPLIDAARIDADPRLKAIKTSTLYAHLGARASKKNEIAQTIFPEPEVLESCAPSSIFRNRSDHLRLETFR